MKIDIAYDKDELKNKNWESLITYLDTFLTDKRDNIFMITAYYKDFNVLEDYENIEKYISQALDFINPYFFIKNAE